MTDTSDMYVDIRQTVPLTPTLVIGLGGSGVNVVRRAKGQIQRYFADRGVPEIPPIMRFLALDSVPLTNPPGVTSLAREEFMYLGQVDGGLIVSNLQLNKEIAAWWDTGRNTPGKIDNGCGQMRDCGRLVFFHHYNAIRAALEAQINAILYQSTIFDTEAHGFELRPNQLRICLVSSVAGGTGSGTFLDATYTVHDIIHQRAGITATVEGYLVLPDVFLPHLSSVPMQESVQANGYAALSELEFLNRHPDQAPQFFSKYPGGHTVNVVRRPFDHTFLVGIRDQRGFGFNSSEQAYESIAQAIYLEGVYLDQAMAENTANVFADSDVAGDVANTGVGRYYSSFSVSSVQVRRDIVMAYCSHRLALDAVHDLLRPDADAGGNVTAPPDEVAAEALVSGLLDNLTRAHPTPELSGRHEAESKPLLETLEHNDEALHAWLDENLRPAQDGARAKQAELRAYVDKQAWSIAVERGIDAVFPYLRGWLHRLQQVSDDLVDRTKALDKQSEEHHAAYEHDRTELDEISLGPGLKILMFDGTAKRRHRREQLFDAGQKSLQSYYDARLRREVVRQVHNVVVRSLLGNTVDDAQGSISRLVKQWQMLREVFQGVQSDVEHGLDDIARVVSSLKNSEHSYVIARQLSLDAANLEAVYTSVLPALGRKDYLLWTADAVEKADPDGLDTPQHLQQETRDLMLTHGITVAVTVCAGSSRDAAAQQAHQVVREAVGRTLGGYIGHTAVLNELFEYNVPYWNYSTVTNLDDVLERTDLVAVESRNPVGWDTVAPEDVILVNRGRERIEHGKETEKIVETGDPSLLAVYRASYGLPLFVLSEVPTLREHYARRRAVNREVQGQKAGLSLHLDRRWNDAPPTDLAADVDGKPIISGTPS